MLVLGLGLGLTGYVLDRSFTASVVAGANEQLKLLIYSLLGAAEEDVDPLLFPSAPLQPPFEQPQSGLYAIVTDVKGNLVWQSPSLRFGSALSMAISKEPAVKKLVTGRFLFREIDGHFE